MRCKNCGAEITEVRTGVFYHLGNASQSCYPGLNRPERAEPAENDGPARYGEPVTETCGECEAGLVPVPASVGCNCDTGPNGEHQPYCGYEPCPNGCWDRLHPPIPDDGA